MTFAATVLTIFPEMFPGPLGRSLAGRALEDGLWSLEVRDIRDSATDRHRSVDDSPAGGGPGMVMRADVLAAAIDAASPEGDSRPRLLMSPRGRPLDQARVRALAAGSGVTIVAGRFEGVDERVIAARELEEVISNKALWPRFADALQSKQNLSIRLNQLAELRNSIRHTRTVRPVTRKDGEASLLWFQEALSQVTPVADDEQGQA